MTDSPAPSRSVIVEREFPHPPDRIWRALTQPDLIGEWLMKTDFQPILGHPFELRGDWGSVSCKVLQIEPNRTLVYTWAAHGLQSVVTWTLVPSPQGTTVRMEQSGFQPGQDQFYEGATAAWPRFLAALERTLSQI